MAGGNADADIGGAQGARGGRRKEDDSDVYTRRLAEAGEGSDCGCAGVFTFLAKKCGQQPPDICEMAGGSQVADNGASLCKPALAIVLWCRSGGNAGGFWHARAHAVASGI